MSYDRKVEKTIKKVKTILHNPQKLLPNATPDSILGTTVKVALSQLHGDIRLNFFRLINKYPDIDKKGKVLLKRSKELRSYKNLTGCNATDVFINSLVTIGDDFLDDRYFRKLDAIKTVENKKRTKDWGYYEKEKETYEKLITNNPDLLLEIDPPMKPLPLIPDDSTPIQILSWILAESGLNVSEQTFEKLQGEPEDIETALFNIKKCVNSDLEIMAESHPELIKRINDGKIWHKGERFRRVK